VALLLTVIHKGGAVTTEWGNYRPVAVVQVISRAAFQACLYHHLPLNTFTLTQFITV
jgi:hypothetical protein